MIVLLVRIGLWIASAYLLAGIAAAVALHRSGLRRIDPAVQDAGALFRVLVTPGMIALWPWMIARWRRAAAAGACPGPVHRPLTAMQVRALHRALSQVLAVVVPLVLGLALLLRPAEVRTPAAAVATLQDAAPLPEVLLERTAPFGESGFVLRLRSDGGRARQLELEIAADLERPGLVALWAPPGAEGDLTGAAPLGAVWGPGRRRFALPPGPVRGRLVLYSPIEGAAVAAAPVEE